MKSLWSAIAISAVLCITSTVCDVNIQDRRIRSSKQLDDHRIVNAVDRRINGRIDDYVSDYSLVFRSFRDFDCFIFVYIPLEIG